VMQGADGNPHSVELQGAAVSRVPSGADKPIPLEADLVDVGPTRNLFVPFEVQVSDLDPGWYVIRTSVRIDSGKPVDYLSRYFTVPWPRSDVRRGTVGLGSSMEAGGRSFRVERVEFGGDTTAVVWRPADDLVGGPAGSRVMVRVVADGRPVQALPDAVGTSRRDRGNEREHRSLFYPVPRRCSSLAVTLRLSSGEETAPLSVQLP
jgi:hypothetical protein